MQTIEKFVTRKELCEIIGISATTFNKKLKSIKNIIMKPGEKRKRLYSPSEANNILEYLRGVKYM